MSTQAAEILTPTQPQSGMQTGSVSALDGDSCIVRLGWREIKASRAISCLVDPKVGDKVAVYTDDDTNYIVHVLSRPDDAAARTITLGKDATLVTVAGEVSLIAGKGINAMTPGHFNLVSGELMLTAREANSNFSSWTSRCEKAEFDSASLKIESVSLEMRAERLSQRVLYSFRWIQELDQLKAGQMFYDVKNVLAMRGKHSVITAEEELKLDGERIHMG